MTFHDKNPPKAAKTHDPLPSAAFGVHPTDHRLGTRVTYGRDDDQAAVGRKAEHRQG